MSMSHDEMIAVIGAHRDGKPIQSKFVNPSEPMDWIDITGSAWDFGTYLYRIKPEPPKLREFWINLHSGMPCSHASKESADKYSVERDECIHVREVLPDEEGKA